VPAETGHDTIAITLVFDLEHDALVRFVNALDVLGNNAVETRAFKAIEPVLGERTVARGGCEVNRRFG